MSKLKIQSTAYPDGDKLSFDDWRAYIKAMQRLNQLTEAVKNFTAPKFTVRKGGSCHDKPNGIQLLFFLNGDLTDMSDTIKIDPAKENSCSSGIPVFENSEFTFSCGAPITNKMLKNRLKKAEQLENYEDAARIRDELNRRKTHGEE